MKRPLLLTALLLVAAILYSQYPGSKMPAGTVVERIVVLKAERKLIAYAHGAEVAVYTVAPGKVPVGAKEYEGDYRTPEGVYRIYNKNPNSKYHKNLGISYPNGADLLHAKQLGKPPGGDVKIHGLQNGLGFIGRFQHWRDWTAGCIALTNWELDDLYEHTPVGTEIEIRP